MSTLQTICDGLGITCSATYGGKVPEGWDRGARPYKVTLFFKERKLTIPFCMGPARTNEPTSADVLYGLRASVRAGEQSFRAFCAEMECDLESRKAKHTWKASQALAPRVRTFLGEFFDDVANAE